MAFEHMVLLSTLSSTILTLQNEHRVAASGVNNQNHNADLWELELMPLTLTLSNATGIIKIQQIESGLRFQSCATQSQRSLR